jgi:hypothetical protein
MLAYLAWDRHLRNTEIATTLDQLARERLSTPNISFQKFALFWVEVDKDIFQLGVVTKLFNLDSMPYLINGLAFDGDSWTLFPRGSYSIKTIAASEDRVEVFEDNYVKSGNEAFFKKLMPIRFEMTIINGSTPEVALRGDWTLIVGKVKLKVVPPLFSVYQIPISLKEWDDLVKASIQNKYG